MLKTRRLQSEQVKTQIWEVVEGKQPEESRSELCKKARESSATGKLSTPRFPLFKPHKIPHPPRHRVPDGFCEGNA